MTVGPVCRLVGSWLKVTTRSSVRHQLSVSPSLEAQPRKRRLPADACRVALKRVLRHLTAKLLLRNHSESIKFQICDPAIKIVTLSLFSYPSRSETQYRFHKFCTYNTVNTTKTTNLMVYMEKIPTYSDNLTKRTVQVAEKIQSFNIKQMANTTTLLKGLCAGLKLILRLRIRWRNMLSYSTIPNTMWRNVPWHSTIHNSMWRYVL